MLKHLIYQNSFNVELSHVIMERYLPHLFWRLTAQQMAKANQFQKSTQRLKKKCGITITAHVEMNRYTSLRAHHLTGHAGYVKT